MKSKMATRLLGEDCVLGLLMHTWSTSNGNVTHDYYFPFQCQAGSRVPQTDLTLTYIAQDDLDFFIFLLPLLSSGLRGTWQLPCLICVVLGQAQGFAHAKQALYRLSSTQLLVAVCFDSFYFIPRGIHILLFYITSINQYLDPPQHLPWSQCSSVTPLGLLLVECAESDFSDALDLKMLSFQPHFYFTGKSFVLFLFSFCQKLNY